MATLTLEEVKAFCHVDTDDEDATLSGLMETAAQVISEQTGKTTYVGLDGTSSGALAETPTFKTAVLQIVSYWNDHRDAAGGDVKILPLSAEMIIAHIKLSRCYT